MHEDSQGGARVESVTEYASILGHERPVRQLECAREAGRVAHAYLFHGPDGVGKERVARTFAKALNCEGDHPPCGGCGGCRAIDRGNHPDVRLVASEEELVARGVLEPDSSRSPSVQIRNAQLDELADLFRHRPYRGRWKVVVIVDADKTNHHSQNRFLKTLEEPIDDSVIILVTAHPENLLPTVRSRCQALAFGTLARSDIAAYLSGREGLDAGRAEVLAAMAQGSLGRALELAAGDVLDTRDEVVEAWEQAREGDLADLLARAEQLGTNRQTLHDSLDLLELWCRDLLLVLAGADQDLLVNQDRRDRVLHGAGQVSMHRLLDTVERVRKTRAFQHLNANPRMAIESLLLSMETP